MRILHVVTMVDEKGSYGGPLTVALGQCAELQRRGHEVLLVAGWQGEAAPPTEIENVPVKLFPVRSYVPGFRHAGLCSGPMHRWLHHAAAGFDVAHVHLARDLVPLAAARQLRRRRVPFIVQTHGMVRPDARPTARLIDRFLTFPALRQAGRLLSLTPEEDADLDRLTAGLRAPTRLENGVAAQGASESARDKADSAPDGALVDVLFLARLHPRKQVLLFARVAEKMAEESQPARFGIVGADGGDLDAVRRFIAERPHLKDYLRYEGAVDHPRALDRLRRADVFVLPSVNEPYPMTVLEALGSGTATICTDSCGLAERLRSLDAALVVPPRLDALADATRSLIVNSRQRQHLAARGLNAARTTFAIPAIVDQLEGMYGAVQSDASEGNNLGLLWITNIATPYRVPLWRKLAESGDLTVALLAESEPNRHWRLDLSGEPFTVHKLRAPVLGNYGDATLYGISMRAHRLLRRRPRAVVMDGWESPAYLALAWHAHRLGVPVIASYRSTQDTHRHPGGLVGAVRRWFLRGASAVVTGGRQSTRTVKGLGVPQERIHVGFNTVDVEAFSKVAAMRERFAPQSGHRFLYVGQLVPRKNVDGLVRAFATITGTDDALTIVGSGPEGRRLRLLVEELAIQSRVHFLGHLAGDDLLAVYAQADTMVLPSHKEVWGLVVNEALAAGLHVVVSDRCGVSADVHDMFAVWIASTTPADLGRAMQQSRGSWSGPTTNHPIIRHSPEALCAVFLKGLEATGSALVAG